MTTLQKVKDPKSSATAHLFVRAINKTAVNKDSIEAITPETDRMVAGIFRNIENPGHPARICMRLYKHQQPFDQVMEDGLLYTIPFSVARAIREYCQHEKHEHLLDDRGQSVKGKKMFQRYDFISTDFR
jgi:hypothetical protein